jgi:class 3 adenylate cyclase/tetratricopeptide (TPR) repeat protein
LAPSLAAEEVRKTVTVVFCDLKGSTSLGERIDTESLRGILTRYFTEMRRVLERHGGTVEKFIGDAVMAVFGLPRVHEDDALRAVRAAMEMRVALLELNSELEQRWGVRLINRIGVNTGEVVSGDVTAGQRLVTGDTVNVAARLEQAAPEMHVLIGDPTYRLVRDAVEVEPLEPLELKGKADPVAAYRLVSVHGAEGYARRHDAPMVGRAQELARLSEAFERAATERGCQVVTIVGPAGVGKSRLIAEFIKRVQARARPLRGRCLPYGEGITFWPLAEVIRAAAGIGEADQVEPAREKIAALFGNESEEQSVSERQEIVDRVAAVMGLSNIAYRIEETFWAARKLVEAVAARQPIVLVFDDIHWAEPTLLDLIEHVAGSSHAAPILILCTARHDLLDERPGWGQGGANTGLLVLQPLSDEESAQVAENLLGSARLPDEVGPRIVEAAQGNPLFVEQMLSMLVDDGTLLQGAEGEWVAAGPVSTLSIPPTISALIAARLDRLLDEERSVIDRGAVIGQVFYRGAIEALVPEPLRDRVRPSLISLLRKELIGLGPSTFIGEDAFRFLHVLIQDTAYRGLLKRSRAEFHEGFADWVEARAGSRMLEFEEILGYHLEKVFRLRLELGQPDDRTRAIGERGSARLGAAGTRALARGDSPAAANLLERAASMLPTESAVRLELLPLLAEALMDLGQFGRAEAVLSEAIDGASTTGDDRLAGRARVVRLMIRFSTDPGGWAGQALEELSPIIATFEQAGDHLGLAKAWALEGYVHGTACRFAAAEDAVGRALEHARLAGDRREEARNLSAYAQSALYGPMPVPEALARCGELLKEAHGDRRAEALVLLALARLNALAGRPDPARDLYRRSRAIYEDLGGTLSAALVSIDSGPVEMLAGDLDAAERELRRDYDALERIGERAYLATTSAWLAQVMYGQERLEEAERFSRVSEESAAPADVETQVLWRCARGKTLARLGRIDEGEGLLREAVAMIEGTEQPDAHGMVLLDLARVKVIAGRPGEAESMIRKARDLFEQKGNVVSSAKATELLAEIGA